MILILTILIISRSLYNQQHTVEFFRHSWHDAKMINLSSLMKLIEKVTLFEFTEKLLNTLFTSLLQQNFITGNHFHFIIIVEKNCIICEKKASQLHHYHYKY